MTKRMTWEEICKSFPDQCVGLVDVENGINDISVKSAVVKYTDKQNSFGVEVLTPSLLLHKAVKGEVVREFTSLDEIGFMGTTNI